MKAGASSSSSEASASSDNPTFLEGKRGRRKRRDCAGTSPEDEESEVEESEGEGAGGSRIDDGRGLGERERRFNAPCGGRGLAGWFRDCRTVFPEEVREKGGAVERLGVRGISFFGIGESLLVDKDEGTRGPPDPVLFIISPAPVSDVLPGTGDGASDPFETPTFRICARTWSSWRS